MRPWDSAQPCARRQAQIDQGGFADAAAVTATARAATRQPQERQFESRRCRRSGGHPRRRTRSLPTRRSRGVAENPSLYLLGTTQTDCQKHVVPIDADLPIAAHCSDWPPCVPRLASRDAVPLLRVPAAAFVNPDLALSRHRLGRPRWAVPDRPPEANAQPRLRLSDRVAAGNGNGPGHCAHRSVADSLNLDQPQPCSGNTTRRHLSHSVGDCFPTGDHRLGALPASGFVGRGGCGGRRAVRPGFGFGRYWVGRPARRQRTPKPSSVPGQWARIASMPARRTTDRRTRATMIASSAYPRTGMKSGTRSKGSAR
jgi:hypothetical protein